MSRAWTADESALDLFARRPVRGFRTGLRFMDDAVIGASMASATVPLSARGDADSSGYQPRQVVEISGDDATPKLLVLLHVVATFLVRSGDREGGHERVYLFDHECDASAPLLFRIVCAKLRARGVDISTAKERARRALERVTLYRCRDTFQWLATLNQLHFELLEATPAPFLLAFHTVGSFQPIDKMVAKSVGDGLALVDQVFVLLKQFIHLHSPFVFATKTTSGAARNGWDTAEFMPRSWSSQVDKRIQLRCGQPPKSEAPRITLFESRSFWQGKSCISTVQVDGLELIEAETESKVPIQTDPPASLALLESDTNAADLWMQ
ncbi:hypothetical protein Poli38472_008842 [Pythium oligandrum]|uniref:Uncharacterized protein n=1 Tax=Pythium oligandrum TaxID=41045 RepID=A0A8K1C4A8_PYTOL|nr:hypothetical protein Poli38472_008842 [Pythium oligandrum]|eukprot:TMW56194.1 hypothetical protein Poli38472_008842 [Pythium oligandrum]